MPNIVAIIKDPKVRQDVEKLLGELASDELRFASFSTQKEFEDLYFNKKSEPLESQETPPVPTPEPSAETPTEGGADLRLFSALNLIIISEDAVTGNIKTVAPEFLKKTKTHGMWPEENRTRIIYLKFEDEHFDKTQITIAALEDLIYLPLDRLLFLQKIEIFLNAPKTIKPSHLFTQQLNSEIEISKIVNLERLTDCALAIRNKTALKPGVRGKFYLAPPSQKNRIRFFGKVFKNEPHPDHPGEFLVYFFFFGVRKNEITAIRRWLGSDPKYHSLISEQAEKFAFNPLDLFLSEDEKRTQSVAIVDFDEEHSKNLAEFLERKIGRLSITTHSSFSLFFETALAPSSNKDSGNFSPLPTSVDDLPKGGLRFSFNRETKNLTHCLPEPSPDHLFCAQPMDQIFKVGDKSWWTSFELKQNELLINEAPSFLSEGKPYKKLLFAKISETEWKGFFADFSMSESDLAVSLLPATTDALMAKAPATTSLTTLDALIIDTVFVPKENFGSWLDGILDRAVSELLVKKREDLKIILISESENRLDEEWLKRDNVVTLLLKPADSKSVAVTLSFVLNNQNTVYNFKNLGWINPHLKTHLAKPVHLNQIGEFGATIDTSTPFKEGAFFYLRKTIYDEAPNGCLAARVYSMEVHPSEPERFLCHVTYFGINEAFLKHARTYMRELYAASKAKG